MNATARVIRFFIYSNLFIALCTAAYTAKTPLLLYGNNGNIHVNLLAFSATLLFYCFHRINKKKFLLKEEIVSERNNWVLTHPRTCYTLIAVSLLILCSQLFYMPLKTWIVFFPVALLGIGYTFPLLPTPNGKKRIRDIYWLKSLWIAIAFAWLTSFLPVIFIQPASYMLKAPVLFIFFRSFLFVFALCIPFDIRDMQFDKLKGVNTLPVTVGVKNAVSIAAALLLLFIFTLSVQYFFFNLAAKPAIALLFSALITLASLLPLRNQNNKHPLFIPLVFDGAMIVQWLLVFLFIHF